MTLTARAANATQPHSSRQKTSANMPSTKGRIFHGMRFATAQTVGKACTTLILLS